MQIQSIIMIKQKQQSIQNIGNLINFYPMDTI